MLKLAVAVLTAACTATGIRAPHNTTPQIAAPTLLTLKSNVFNNTRAIHILLPPGYNDPENQKRRYPVFYFADGIAAFGLWGLPAVAADLWSRHEIQEVIFVGIDNGGSAKESTDPPRDRASEYLPYADQSYTTNAPEPRGLHFPAFLFGEVMPLINRTFRTRVGAANTGLAGDSFAGAVALYTAMKYRGKIGYLLLESPSLHIGNGQLLADAEHTSAWPKAIYLGVGTREGATADIQLDMLNNVRKLDSILTRNARAARRSMIVQDGGTHWYDSWRTRLPNALRFLLGGPASR
jgi:enterochelin esterase-like enzyme